MNKRQDLLDKISDKYLRTKDTPSGIFLRMMWNYYVITDLETDYQLADIFFQLYMCKEKLSYDDIVAKFSIGLSTLNRYRLRFNGLAEKLLPKQF